MRQSLRLLLITLTLTASACGGYARSSDASKAPTTTGAVQIGDDFETITTRPRSVVTTPAGDGGGDAVVEREDKSVASNQSTYDSPEGFRLILTVEGPLSYGSNEDIRLSVLVWNVSKQDLQYDPNDLRNFAFRPVGSSKTAWTDGDCRGARVPKALETRAQTLRPNEQTTFVDTYPGPTDAANRDSCRVGNGAYSVFGLVSWCPAGTTNSQGVCDPERTRQIASAGVRIQLR